MSRGSVSTPAPRARISAVSWARNSGLLIAPIEADARQPAGEGLGLAAPGGGQGDVDVLAEMLLGLRAIREAVAGEDEGEHDASLGGPSRGTMPTGGTSETPMSDHEPTPANDADAPDAGHADDHGGGHGDHHDGGTLGPIAWRMWGVGILGVVVALIVVAAFVVATDFVFLTPAA